MIRNSIRLAAAGALLLAAPLLALSFCRLAK